MTGSHLVYGTENSLSRLFGASALLDPFSLDYSYNLLIRDGGLCLETKELNSTSMRPHPHLISNLNLVFPAFLQKVTTYLTSNFTLSPPRIQACPLHLLRRHPI